MLLRLFCWSCVADIVLLRLHCRGLYPSLSRNSRALHGWLHPSLLVAYSFLLVPRIWILNLTRPLLMNCQFIHIYIHLKFFLSSLQSAVLSPDVLYRLLYSTLFIEMADFYFDPSSVDYQFCSIFRPKLCVLRSYVSWLARLLVFEFSSSRVRIFRSLVRYIQSIAFNIYLLLFHSFLLRVPSLASISAL